MIRVNNISYGYQKNSNILENITFDAFEGTVNVLLGKNGQGKTTLLKLINRIYKVKEIDISIDDKSLNDYKPNELAKKISYVSQDNILAPLNVFEAVMIGRIPHYNNLCTSADYDKVKNALEELNILHLANRYVSTLSGGEKQMVYIARAIAQEAKYILLDEPMNNLDIENQIALARLIKKISKEKGICFIITMHDINFSLMLGDYFILLKDHRIAYQGTEEIITEDTIREVYNVDCKISIEGNKKIINYGG